MVTLTGLASAFSIPEFKVSNGSNCFRLIFVSEGVSWVFLFSSSNAAFAFFFLFRDLANSLIRCDLRHFLLVLICVWIGRRFQWLLIVCTVNRQTHRLWEKLFWFAKRFFMNRQLVLLARFYLDSAFFLLIMLLIKLSNFEHFSGLTDE